MNNAGIIPPSSINGNKRIESSGVSRSFKSEDIATIIREFVNSAAPARSDEIERQRKKDLARKIWDESRPAKATLVEHYLSRRGLVFKDDLPEALRFHPHLLHEPTRQHYPAMIASVYDAENQFCGIHRTYLAPDGDAIAIVPQGGVRRMLGSCFGGYIRLHSGSPEKIVIVEDIEVALSVAQVCPELTVWASMVLGNLRAPVPLPMADIVFCADGKNKDLRMAERILLEAAQEHKERGHKVFIASAPRGMDFNDVLLMGRTD